jgi:hypothetical protein
MRVAVPISVDIDPEAWSRNYGTAGRMAEIREDVKSYVESLVQEHLDSLGLLMEKED